MPKKGEIAPDQRMLGSILDEVPQEKQEAVAREACEQYDIDLESRTDWEEKRARWYNLWACIREPKNTPWENASNVCIPALAGACNQFHGRSYQSVFGPPGLAKTFPVGRNDIRRAKNVENFLNWQLMHEMEEYEEQFDKLLQLLPLNGVAFKKIYYSKELDRPVTENIDALDLVLPYGTRSFDDSRRMTHRLWLHYDQLLDREARGLYRNVEKIRQMPESEDDSDLQQTALQASGENPTRKEEKPHLILEVHKNYDLGAGRKPYIFTIDKDSETILRVSERKFNGKTLNYFVDYHFLPNPQGFYSFGFGHFLEPLIEMANTAFNQIFDAGRLTNQPFGFYGRRAGVKKAQIKLQPGVMTEVSDASQIFFPSMQRLDQVLFLFLGQIQQYIEQFTSTSDYIQGRESKGTKTPTAHGTLAIIEQGLVTFAVMTKRIFRSLRKELRLISNLNQLFLPDSKEYRIVGGKDKIAFADIKRADFEIIHDVLPTGDPSYANMGKRRQEAIERYQVLMSNPLVVGNPDMGMQPNIKGMYAVTSDYLDTHDIKNKDEILPPLPEQPMTQEYENALMAQGDYSEPKPGENHMQHAEILTRFMRGEIFASLPEEYKQLFETHYAQTQQLYVIEQQYMEQLGGNNGGNQGGNIGMVG
jgi:hypothetical protein